jgi:type I restriction enzyme R subunit
MNHSEAAFETVIESHLLTNGYVTANSGSFDRTRAIFPEVVLSFIHETQPKEWAKLEALHGTKTGEQVLTDLCKWMDTYGSLATLRHGFKCYGRTLHVAFFKAAHGLNPELEARYAANRVGLTRQLHFSERNEKSLDVTISLNGVPVATLELKNPLTGQTVNNAQQQYCQDRDPREPIFGFKRRTLVHFAVDTEAVFMTTRLASGATHFLPFNKGHDGSAGNPPDLRKEARQRAAEEGLEDMAPLFRSMAKRGRQANLSFFAFTATPKHKTLAVFGRNGQPFHRYTMRQAIEEGFIMDVLKHYTSYATYFRLLKACEDDPNVERKKAAKALARFLRLHPHNIAQKTEIMVEHFNAVTRHKMGGKAKAMVVTGSRLEAVRYKESFDHYIKEKGYLIKTLVAFSGTVIDDKLPDKTYTEEGMNNGIKEKELPEKFATPEYRVLLVAEKYQTGFDQPFLHTMYVDKRLAGIQAVQTLSRLNRMHPLKEDTFVLDFVNDRQEIQEAFKQFYEGAEMGEEVDPVRMYQIKADLDGTGVYLAEEVQHFCSIFFKPRERQSPADHQAMNAALDPAVDRFRALQENDEEEAELWRGKLQAFRNLYAFLSQIIPYQDSDLERRYTFLRHLSAKLPKRNSGPRYNFDDEVRLEYYRLQKISEGSISLKEGSARPLDGPTEVGSGLVREEVVRFSRLIDVVNQRFGTDFTEADQLFFDQIMEAALADASLQQAAQVNPVDKFALVFTNLLDTLFVERMEQNEEIFARFMNEDAFRKVIGARMASEVYQKLKSKTGNLMGASLDLSGD